MKFLIIQTAFIGDVILATPIIEKLRFFYPKSTIDILIRDGNQLLFENHPYINKIYVWHKNKSKYFSLYRVIKEIRKTYYDHIFNVQRYSTTGLITMLARGKETWGFDKNPFSRFFSHRITHTIGNGLHETERNLKLIQ